jgi:hypothetical protein
MNYKEKLKKLIEKIDFYGKTNVISSQTAKSLKMDFAGVEENQVKTLPAKIEVFTNTRCLDSKIAKELIADAKDLTINNTQPVASKPAAKVEVAKVQDSIKEALAATEPVQFKGKMQKWDSLTEQKLWAEAVKRNGVVRPLNATEREQLKRAGYTDCQRRSENGVNLAV